MREWFRKFSGQSSDLVGSPGAFILATLTIIVWAVTGPLFRFSDTWQLVINTGTTIVTFLMVFLIQNTQNRDAKAIHLKLDELLRGVEGARTGFVDLENLPDKELKAIAQQFRELKARQADIEARGEHLHREFHAAMPEVIDDEAHDVVEGEKMPKA